jgi:hypothetical protein
MSAKRGFAAALCLVLPLALAACGGDDIPPTEPYTQLHYDYLSKLRLNVGNVVVQDQSHPIGPDDIAAQSPAIPALALQQMAHDRLFAAALAGTATFVVDQASIEKLPNGTLDGVLAVHLDITTPGGASAGFAAARVEQRHIPGSDPENQQNNLYDLTKKMMEDMNTEFEFQLRKGLSSWLVTGAAIPAPVEAQPLGPAVPAPPQTVPPAPSASPAPPPPNDGYQDPLAPAAPPPPPPPQMSPPPTYLQPPPGAAPSNGY